MRKLNIQTTGIALASLLAVTTAAFAAAPPKHEQKSQPSTMGSGQRMNGNMMQGHGMMQNGKMKNRMPMMKMMKQMTEMMANCNKMMQSMNTRMKRMNMQHHAQQKSGNDG